MSHRQTKKLSERQTKERQEPPDIKNCFSELEYNTNSKSSLDGITQRDQVESENLLAAPRSFANKTLSSIEIQDQEIEKNNNDLNYTEHQNNTLVSIQSDYAIGQNNPKTLLIKNPKSSHSRSPSKFYHHQSGSSISMGKQKRIIKGSSAYLRAQTISTGSRVIEPLHSEPIENTFHINKYLKDAIQARKYQAYVNSTPSDFNNTYTSELGHKLDGQTTGLEEPDPEDNNHL